jgi:dsDNA-specific endonuclease/ATPase MutS2
MELKSIKKEYDALARKYNLPNFSKLNEELEVERVNHETETVLRAVRKAMMEKIINMLGFLEMFINPVNVPRMYMPYIKAIDVEDKKEIDTIYEDFSAITMEGLDLEVDYSEKAEADFIRKVFEKWNSVKPSMRSIMANMRRPKSEDNKRERNYYG